MVGIDEALRVLWGRKREWRHQSNKTSLREKQTGAWVLGGEVGKAGTEHHFGGGHL